MLPIWSRWGLSFLIWLSPYLSLGIFFPLGVLFVFPLQYRLRRAALAVIFIQCFVWIPFFLLRVGLSSSLDLEESFNSFLLNDQLYLDLKLFILFPLALLVVASFFIAYLRTFNRKRKDVNGRILRGRPAESNLISLLLVLFFGLMLFITFEYFFSQYLPAYFSKSQNKLVDLYNFYLNSTLSIFSVWFLTFGKKPVAIFAKAFASWERGQRLREVWKRNYEAGVPFSEESQKQIIGRGFFREKLLPGFGHIYFGDYWRGFPLLFLFLLLLLFTAVWIFSYLSPVFGIQFLALLGLKPGIPDKDFFIATQNVSYAIISFSALVAINLYSRSLLKYSLLAPKYNFTILERPEKKEPFVSGIRKGFQNILPISLLVHLILLALFFIIPISLQRASQKKKGEENAKHFQPEKLEFYFIDPEVPDMTKGLNGGVITGNEQKFRESGEKISNEKVADNGPKSGYIKKIRGKKLPPTYSNYISAKMRVPETYMEYWARAPHPYSSVVAYTITQEGEVTDIQLVEGSRYPEQDLRTLQLIERLGPLIPPPNTKGDIRVTELFWNGPIDPNFVPTPLQKEMINLFDGRYMEELSD